MLLVLNVWPRATLFVCFVCFLSFVAAAQDFSGYQSDGMLLEAGFIAMFFAPAGFLPGLGRRAPPSRASLFLLQWEWFRIYFESGVMKLASDARAGAWVGLHAVSAAPLPNRVLLHRYGVADPGDPHRKLHVPELPGFAVGSSASG